MENVLNVDLSTSIQRKGFVVGQEEMYFKLCHFLDPRHYKGAFTLGQIAWSEPDLLLLSPPSTAGLCSHCIICVRAAMRLRHQAAATYPCRQLTTMKEKVPKLIGPVLNGPRKTLTVYPECLGCRLSKSVHQGAHINHRKITKCARTRQPL